MERSGLIILCLCLCLLQYHIAGAQKAFLIKKYAAVHGERVRFDEIAMPQVQWAWQKWPELKDILLWNISKQQMLVIPAQKLKCDLRRFLGGMADLCFVAGQIVLKRANAVLDKEELRKKAVIFLTEKGAFEGEEVTFRDFRLPEAIFLDQNEVVDVEAASGLKPGRNSLRFVACGFQGNQVRSYTGSVFIDVWKTVPCAARVVNRKEVLEPSLVRFEKKNLAYVHGEVWDGKGGPWRVKRPVGEGQIFMLSNLESAPLLQRGDKVTLKFQGRFVSLAVPAIVLEDGNVGDDILVKNLQSNRKVRARIVDEATIIVR